MMGSEEQLYGFLTNSIIENAGLFNDEIFQNIIEKLISFFPSDEESEEYQRLNDRLTFLHKLLGKQIKSDSEIEQQLKLFEYKGAYNKSNKSLRQISEFILEGYSYEG